MMHPCALIILDGFGYSSTTAGNAIANANMPCYRYLLDTYPHTLLNASGSAVGLPEQCMGNSEAGHITIGTGTVIKQPLTLLLELIKSGKFASNPAVQAALEHAKQSGNRVHILGLLSDGGVHCDFRLIAAYAQAAAHYGLHTYLHLFSDGRDMLPESFLPLWQKLRTLMPDTVQLATIIGRFYAMDRNNNYDRTAAAYHALTIVSTHSENIETAVEKAYKSGYTDQNLPAIQFDQNSRIQTDDTVILANVRPERTMQLAHALQYGIPGHEVTSCALFQPVAFDSSNKNPAIITPLPITSSLSSILGRHKKRVLLLAETEKAAHVQRFIRGAQDAIHNHESFIIVPSIVTDSYARYPRMSADTITYFARKALKQAQHDLYIINYANADMVGHTGDYEATVWACECLDDQLSLLYQEIVCKNNGTLIITGDHGNAEHMIDSKTEKPDPRHTTNQVPLICATKNEALRKKIRQASGLKDILGITLAALELSGYSC